MTYSIDYTALADPAPDRQQDPFYAIGNAKPYREKPSGRLIDYAGTRFDLFTVYLPRIGISLQETVKAFGYGHVKVIECAGKVYLNATDGLVHERNIKDVVYIKKELKKRKKVL